MNRYDTIIIGAGLAGLATACQLACLGQKVLLIGQGHGSLLLASGCIDVLGFQPVTSKKPVRNPLSQLADFIREHPDHPYHFTGIDTLEAGLKAFQALVNHSKLPYQGIIKNNWFLPSPAGVIHPTCLAPLSLANGELSGRGHMLIVGFYQLRDFYPGLISQNLTQQDLGFPIEALTVELPSMPIADDHNVTSVELALMFEQPNFRQQVINRLKNRSKGFHRIGFPAVLGLKEHTAVIVDMQNQLNSTVFEISTLPPSVPGRRLLETLRQVLVDAGGHMIVGSQVLDGVIENGRATQIRFETASQPKTIKAANFVLATGGIYGGGIQTDAEGGLGRVWEPIFGLPVAAESNRHLWFAQNFLDPKGQPFANFGVRVNNRLNPVDEANIPIADNLYIAGATIAGGDWTRGRTGEGVALATAAAIVKRITGRIYDDESSPA